MTKPRFDIGAAWKVSDPREAPAYSIAQAAHYLCIPKQTVRAWVRGTSYGRSGNRKTFEPVIDLPDPTSQLLSFFNLAEVHVLRALRTDHAIKLPRASESIDSLATDYGCDFAEIEEAIRCELTLATAA